MADTIQFIPQFALKKDGTFLPWEDYIKQYPELKKRYFIGFTKTGIYVNDVRFAEKSERFSPGSVKSSYVNEDKTQSIVVYTSNWAKIDTARESVVGLLV